MTESVEIVKEKEIADKQWHALAVEDVFSFLNSSSAGLTEGEAEQRLSQWGENRLSPPRKKSPFMRFLLQFHNVLIYVLLGAGLITAFLGHWIDAGVIVGVVVINSIIGFIQEGKAEKALEAIKTMLSQQATVFRAGKRLNLPSTELVPGDIVFLQSGDKVPADLRLVKIKELRIDEAMLTGESMPVEKRIIPSDSQASLGDRFCLAYSGTLVTYGQGTGVVTETGDRTEIGRINQLLAKVPTLTTKLLLQMAEFSEKLTLAIGAIAALTILFGIFVRNYQLNEMFLVAVGLAVAAIPEGLPAVVTITLAVGVQRMAKRHAIIRRLPAVETLGSVTVICSDKTGTLTRNEMAVQSVATLHHIFEISGEGYAPLGSITCKDTLVKPEDHPEIIDIARACNLCNDSEIQQSNGSWNVHGDPTEGALIALAGKAGVSFEEVRKDFPRIDLIPFESEHRFMATLNRGTGAGAYIFLKGAPEKVLTLCQWQRDQHGLAPLDVSLWHHKINELAIRGQRVLAIAYREVSADLSSIDHEIIKEDLVLLGLTGSIDPPRSEAVSAVKQCQRAGIRVKMITGDHAATALAIGKQIGFQNISRAITGEELAVMNDIMLKAAVQDTDIFARVSPEHKLKLVQALQANGEVVAMTGDGVNDAPALKRADVGVAMGMKGTEVAKEAAEMVLTDDNFASISHAVEEGRTVYANIKKAISFILPTNGGEAGIIIAAIMSGRMLPITPVQILWVNMITAITLALALAFDPPEKDIMEKPPRNPTEAILSPFLVWRVGFVSVILIFGTYGLFLWERMHDVSIEQARTVAVNTLVLFEIFYLFNSRSLKKSVLSKEGILGNRIAIFAAVTVFIIQLLYTYAGPLQTLFSSAALPAMSWLRIITIASSVFILVELEKALFQRWENKKRIMPKRPTVQLVQPK